MKDKETNKTVRFSIRKKILMVATMAALPFLALVVYLLLSVSNYGKAYDSIVSNLKVANNYNLKFKDEMDESLYKLVVGYVTFDNISREENLENPYILIDELKDAFKELRDITTGAEGKLWLESLLRNIDTLEDRVDDIVQNVADGEKYDENIKELDDNIYILTELIQDDIQNYIYYQTKSMDAVTNNLNDQLGNFVIICGVLIAVLVIIVTLLTIVITSGILRPVRELYEATGKIAKGDFGVQAKTNTNDEIAVLAEGFNNMAGNMQSLINTIKEDEQKMRRADLRLLQEQINPHFLYNTLDTIIWLIEGSESDQAVDMVVALSDFFRLVLSKGKEFISIEEEEVHIRSYLEIQEMRYHDILEYDIQIDAVLYQYQILKLTLQPIIENALYHGIKHKRAKGCISIYGEKINDVIRFTIRDDGIGMEAKELETLQEDIKRPCKETERGFGLANVNERIRMYFGEQYGLKLSSKQSKGTIIEITIPAIKIQEKNEVLR